MRVCMRECVSVCVRECVCERVCVCGGIDAVMVKRSSFPQKVTKGRRRRSFNSWNIDQVLSVFAVTLNQH